MDVVSAAAGNAPMPAAGVPAPRPRLDRATLLRLALLVVFAAWVLDVGARHEPWLDEAQAWLVARDNGLVELLLHRIRYEGTPGLWHVLLWLAIRAGLPFSGLFLLSGGLAIAGAAVVLWRAPFPLALRIAILASYFFSYQYAVVARSYALDLLLVPLLASRFATRRERPIGYALILGLLANTNAHSFLAAGVVGAELLWALARSGELRRRPALVALGTAAALGLFAAATAWQPADNAYLEIARVPPTGIETGANYVREAFVSRLWLCSPFEPTPQENFLGLLVTLLLVPVSFLLFRRAGTAAMAIALCAVLIGFSCLKYAFGWHAGLLFLFWLFCLWASWPAAADDPVLRRLVLASTLLICGAQAVGGIASGLRDIRQPYSAGPAAARLIEAWRAAHPGVPIAAAGNSSFAVQPFFPANLFANYHGGAPRPAYVGWSRDERWRGGASPAEIATLLATKPGLVVVAPNAMPPPDSARLAHALCASGYGTPLTVAAGAIWKGIASSDDSLLLYRAGTRRGGAC